MWKKDYWIIQFISHFLSPPLPLDPSLSKPELPPGLGRKMAPCCSLELPPDLDGEAGPPKILTIIRASCPWAFRVGAPPVSAAWWWCCECSLMKMLLWKMLMASWMMSTNLWVQLDEDAAVEEGAAGSSCFCHLLLLHQRLLHPRSMTLTHSQLRVWWILQYYLPYIIGPNIFKVICFKKCLRYRVQCKMRYKCLKSWTNCSTLSSGRFCQVVSKVQIQ